MNIVIVPRYFLPRRGGLEISTYNLAKALFKKGYNLKVITTQTNSLTAQYELIDNIIEVHRFRFFLPPSLLKLIKLFNNYKTKVIFVHYLGIYIYYLIWLRYIFKFKIIVSLYGFQFDLVPLSKLAKRLNTSLLSYTLKHADAIMGHTRKELLEAQKIAPSIINKSYRVPAGVDLEEFKGDDKYVHNRAYIFSSLRFIYRKGADILIMAFDIIVKKRCTVDLIISGFGPGLKDCKKLIALLGLENRIFIFSNNKRIEQIRLLKGCDFFVLPSRIDSFSIVLLETMAAGKAIVATNLETTQELIQDSINGLLVEPQNDKALAEGIRRLLDDRDLCQKLGQNNKMAAQKYSCDKIADRYLEVYQNCLGRK